MDSEYTPGTSVIRRNRPTAIMARLATQPYPATNRKTRAWLEGLDDADLIGSLNTTEESSTAPQETASPTLADDCMEEEDDGEQSALAEDLSLGSHDFSIGNIPMQESWENATDASTMHTASMYDWNGEEEDEAILRSSNAVGQDTSLYGYNEEGEYHDGGSVYAPSSRSVSPPRVSPRKRKRYATRKEVLDEEYDGEHIEPAINGGALVGQGALELYLPSSTAVENNSTSSPPGSPPPPPPPRRQGILRGKVARRSWKPRVNFGSR